MKAGLSLSSNEEGHLSVALIFDTMQTVVFLLCVFLVVNSRLNLAPVKEIVISAPPSRRNDVVEILYQWEIITVVTVHASQGTCM